MSATFSDPPSCSSSAATMGNSVNRTFLLSDNSRCRKSAIAVRSSPSPQSRTDTHIRRERRGLVAQDLLLALRFCVHQRNGRKAQSDDSFEGNSKLFLNEHVSEQILQMLPALVPSRSLVAEHVLTCPGRSGACFVLLLVLSRTSCRSISIPSARKHFTGMASHRR
jgi:hypothetical protein